MGGKRQGHQSVSRDNLKFVSLTADVNGFTSHGCGGWDSKTYLVCILRQETCLHLQQVPLGTHDTRGMVSHAIQLLEPRRGYECADAIFVWFLNRFVKTEK